LRQSFESAPRNKRKGSSLSVQKEQIINAVNSMNGVVPDDCWKYFGQEHATPDHERKMLDKLLEDCDMDAKF
jgi:hypothetical protein